MRAASVALAAPAVEGAPAAGHHGKNPVHPFFARDLVMIITISNFLRDIRHSFARAQAHAIFRSVLIFIFMVADSAAFLLANENLEPSLFLMLCMSQNTIGVPDESCLRS